jgi:hypothetical protein
MLDENGLSINGLVANGLRMNGLRMNGLRMNGFSINDLSTPDSVDVMKYLVGCALRPDQTLTIYDDTATDGSYTWWGALGLAPEMETDPLDDPASQRWVSACMLAHVNSVGAHITISLRGSAPSLATTKSEREGWPFPDGAYWGNLFTAPAALLACAPTKVNQVNGGLDNTLPDGRNCDLGACGLDEQGSCDQVCGAQSEPDGAWSACAYEGMAVDEVVSVFVLDEAEREAPITPAETSP